MKLLLSFENDGFAFIFNIYYIKCIPCRFGIVETVPPVELSLSYVLSLKVMRQILI